MRWVGSLSFCASIAVAGCSSQGGLGGAGQPGEGDVATVSQALEDPYIYNAAGTYGLTTMSVAIASIPSTNGFDNLNFAWTDSSSRVHLVMENACSGGTPQGGGLTWASSIDSPVLAYGVSPWGAGALRMAWTGTESQHYVHFSSIYGVILNDREDVTIYESTLSRPAMTWTSNGLLFLAWRRQADNMIVVTYAKDAVTFPVHFALGDSTDSFPVLTANGNDVYLGWKGNGNNWLNVAKLTYDSNGVTGLTNKVWLKSSPWSPGLKAYNGNLYLAWAGDTDNALHTMVSLDGGQTFGQEQYMYSLSAAAPTLDWCYDRLATPDPNNPSPFNQHNHPAITWVEYDYQRSTASYVATAFLGSIAQ